MSYETNRPLRVSNLSPQKLCQKLKSTALQTCATVAYRNQTLNSNVLEISCFAETMKKGHENAFFNSEM